MSRFGRIPHLASGFAGIAIALMCQSPALSAPAANKDSMVCADKEALLSVLAEAHGTVPNPASLNLTDQALTITQARYACANDRAADALPVYDRLIGQLTESLRSSRPTTEAALRSGTND